jgi:hypothetical protein
MFGGIAAQETLSTPNGKREAEKSWESLIKEKGGREKLYSINNMLTELSASSTRLDIFPNLYWGINHRSDGAAIVTIADFAKNDQYFANEQGVTDIKHGSFVSAGLIHRVAFLLETKWDKPEPKKVTRMEGSKSLDSIETLLHGRRIDFVFDPEELLVSRVILYDEKQAIYEVILLADYTEINGIEMPRTYERLTGSKVDYSYWKNTNPKLRAIKFEFNVDFDPMIFKRPLRAGSKDDWKAKKKKN